MAKPLLRATEKVLTSMTPARPVTTRHQADECDAPGQCRPRTVEERRGRSDVRPQHPAHDARDQSGEAHGRHVPADTAGPQFLRHEVTRQRLAYRAEDALVEAVEGEQEA